MREIRKLSNKRILAFGWDRPLSTFYAQVGVEDEGEVGECPDLWIGTLWQEIDSPTALAVYLEPHYVLTPEDLKILAEQKQKNPASAHPSAGYRALNNL